MGKVNNNSLPRFLLSAKITSVCLLQALSDSGAHIDWFCYCHQNCLKSASPPGESVPASVPRDAPDFSHVHRDLAKVFHSDSTLSLPPHHPCDFILLICFEVLHFCPASIE